MFEGWTCLECEKAEQEQCEDAVSRQAVCEIISDIRDCISVEGYWAILERLKKLPSVRPQEPNTGRWIMDRQLERRTCDNCNTKYRWSFYPHNYCPNCGAKMVEPREREGKK